MQGKNIQNNLKKIDAEFKDSTSIINGKIAVCDYVYWGSITLRFRNYFYTDGSGKIYTASIVAFSDNWDNIKEVVQVFEQSLKFKQ
ncbi:MAG: hypothetical protein PHF25_08935 [Candidatus Margulisbacteria bacterium]|nr:hypothetical protein [Candidatus Margulisiibacteriota bacterium]